MAAIQQQDSSIKMQVRGFFLCKSIDWYSDIRKSYTLQQTHLNSTTQKMYSHFPKAALIAYILSSYCFLNVSAYPSIASKVKRISGGTDQAACFEQVRLGCYTTSIFPTSHLCFSSLNVSQEGDRRYFQITSIGMLLTQSSVRRIAMQSFRATYPPVLLSTTRLSPVWLPLPSSPPLLLCLFRLFFRLRNRFKLYV
jgi:hypothetical protein